MFNIKTFVTSSFDQSQEKCIEWLLKNANPNGLLDITRHVNEMSKRGDEMDPYPPIVAMFALHGILSAMQRMKEIAAEESGGVG